MRGSRLVACELPHVGFARATQRYARVVDELIDIGTDLARIVLEPAKTQIESAKAIDALGQNDQGFSVRLIPTLALTPDPIAPYARITRAMRRTIILGQKLHEPPKAPASPQRRDHNAARKRIIRNVEDTIQRTTKDGDEPERLNAELLERLDGPDLDDDIGHLPNDEIIKDIYRDLGIAHAPGTHPWKRRTAAIRPDLKCSGEMSGIEVAFPA